MRSVLSKSSVFFALIVALAASAGCTIASFGPYSLELQYSAPAAPTPPPGPPAAPTPALPNLTVESVIINDGSGQGPNCLAATSVDFTVRNTGAVQAPASVVAIQDYVPSTGALVQMSAADAPSLAAGDTYSGRVTVSFGPPPGVPHVLRVRADAADAVGETSEADNVHETEFVLGDPGTCGGPVVVQPTETPATDAPPALNLTLVGVTITGSGVNPRCGDASRIDFTVQNSGQAAFGATIIDFYDYELPTSDFTAWAQGQIPPLQPGETYSGSATITVGPPPNVNHRLLAYADAGRVLDESNEDDNGWTLTYNVDDIGLCD